MHMFQQDNDLKHIVKIELDGFECLEWSHQSPSIKPTDQIHLKKAASQQPSSNLTELERICWVEWYKNLNFKHKHLFMLNLKRTESAITAKAAWRMEKRISLLQATVLANYLKRKEIYANMGSNFTKITCRGRQIWSNKVRKQTCSRPTLTLLTKSYPLPIKCKPKGHISEREGQKEKAPLNTINMIFLVFILHFLHLPVNNGE